jgi:hypothetical protein
MACALTLHHPRDWALSQHAESISKGVSRTERIRQLLRLEGRAMTDSEIAFDLVDHFPDFGAHLVWLLLKYDIKKGRVLMIRPGLYRYNEEFDTAEAEALRNAEKLLRSHGYKLKAPQ